MTIHCIGDSHVRFFQGEQFKIYWLGAVTAFNLGDKEGLWEILEQLPKGDWVMLVAGEIDCRVHLGKQADLQKRFLINVVEECVDRYFTVIRKVKEKGFKPIIWGVTASSVKQIDRGEYASYGDCQTRNNITRIFNDRLAYWAEKENMPMISIFNKLVDSTLNTKTEYYQDAIHLSSKCMPWVLEELERKVWKTKP